MDAFDLTKTEATELAEEIFNKGYKIKIKDDFGILLKAIFSRIPAIISIATAKPVEKTAGEAKADENKAGCYSWSDLDEIQNTINEIKKTCRWCVVVAHAGEEFTPLPSPYTRERYHKYLEMGADIVVAHHPHVPMNYETVGDKVIFYSLGNFILLYLILIMISGSLSLYFAK